MADYGFRLTKDRGGKHSVPETIDRSWDKDELRKKMGERVDQEIAELKKKGISAFAIKDSSQDVVEVREIGDNTLMAWFEIEEFEHK